MDIPKEVLRAGNLRNLLVFLEERVLHLAADVGSALATNCARAGLEVDDIELSVKGRLDNVLAHLGLEEGDPSFALIELTGFVSSFEDEARVRAVWDETLGRSPLVATLKKAVELRTRLAMV